MIMIQKRPPRSMQTREDAEFWAWCDKGELHLQRCGDCGHMVFPPMQPCEACGSSKVEWEKLSGRGKLASWCTIERDYYKGAIPLPWDTIVVELDEGPYFLSNPEGFTNAVAEYGMAVEVTFIDCEDEHGQYKLPVFKPA